MTAALRLVVVGMAALALVACESTQDKSARLAKSGSTALKQEGLDVRKRNRDVKVVDTAVLQDVNGAAAVVVLRNTARAPLRGVPVEINVLGRSGKSVFRNNEAGLDPSLVGPSVLPPGTQFAWVHDQVVVYGKVGSVKVTPGREEGTVNGKLPEIEWSEPRLQGDPVSGIEATGTISNRSDIDQRELIIYCVARKGGRIVAAGRGGIPRLRPGQTRNYHIFFIGNPRGAELTLAAPPVNL
jgi:hypothetical protein